MVLRPFEARLAVDGNTLEAAPGATGLIYARDDTAFTTPLTALDSNGLPVELTANSMSVLPNFWVEDHTAVNWRSGDWVFPLTSSEPIEGPKGEPGQDGAPGQDGRDGSNVVPTDQAIAEAITTPGTPANTALSATIAEQIGGTSTLLRGVVSETAPSNPTAGMVWFDTSVPVTGIDAIESLLARWDATELSGADGSKVTTLAPRSGSRTTVLSGQAVTAGNEPLLRTNVVNGLPVVRFDKALQQWLHAPLSTTGGGVAQPLTAYAVFRVTAADSTVVSSADSTFLDLRVMSAGTTVEIASAGTGAAPSSTAWSAAGGFMAVVIVADGANSKAYWTARTPASFTAGTGAGYATGFRIGRNASTRYAAMDWAESGLFNTALADADVQTILDELADKYALTLGA